MGAGKTLLRNGGKTVINRGRTRIGEQGDGHGCCCVDCNGACGSCTGPIAKVWHADISGIAIPSGAVDCPTRTSGSVTTPLWHVTYSGNINGGVCVKLDAQGCFGGANLPGVSVRTRADSLYIDTCNDGVTTTEQDYRDIPRISVQVGLDDGAGGKLIRAQIFLPSVRFPGCREELNPVDISTTVCVFDGTAAMPGGKCAGVFTISNDIAASSCTTTDHIIPGFGSEVSGDYRFAGGGTVTVDTTVANRCCNIKCPDLGACQNCFRVNASSDGGSQGALLVDGEDAHYFTATHTWIGFGDDGRGSATIFCEAWGWGEDGAWVVSAGSDDGTALFTAPLASNLCPPNAGWTAQSIKLNIGTSGTLALSDCPPHDCTTDCTACCTIIRFNFAGGDLDGLYEEFIDEDPATCAWTENLSTVPDVIGFNLFCTAGVYTMRVCRFADGGVCHEWQANADADGCPPVDPSQWVETSSFGVDIASIDCT